VSRICSRSRSSDLEWNFAGDRDYRSTSKLAEIDGTGSLKMMLLYLIGVGVAYLFAKPVE
jgi:hypothetical protein